MEKYIIDEKATILDALTQFTHLDDISRIILFVCNNEKQIIGSLTDGDIRRALIKYHNINQLVGEVCNKQFRHQYIDDQYINIKEYRKLDIRILPILDKQHHLIEILDLSRVKAKLPLEAVIMAGGRGQRLQPLTDTVPKPMLPLAGKPIIEHNIDQLIEYGIKKIYISIKYLGQQIVDYFGDGSKKGIKIEYIWEDQPLGTAGALSLIDSFSTKHILLMNSDLYTDIDYEKLYCKAINSLSNITIATIPYEYTIPYGIFQLEGDRVAGISEKPKYVHYANAGIYMINIDALKDIPKNKFFNITDLIDVLIKKGQCLTQYPISGTWIDIGQPQDYDRAKSVAMHKQR